MTQSLAPAWQVSEWLNTPQPLTLEALRGRVVVMHTFQMLCPGCVANGLPQAQKVHEMFSPDDVAVVGLHTVFEHHAAMTRIALEAFIHEYRLTFPIGIDQAAPQGPVPLTMHTYGLRGTPSLVLIDRAGQIRMHEFGHVPDLVVGAAIGQLVAQREVSLAAQGAVSTVPGAEGCGPDGCPVPKH